jgi:acetyl esterase/lipase
VDAWLAALISLGAALTPAADYRDVTCRPDSAPTAAVVYLHGGAFLAGGPDDWLRERCEPFAHAGYLTISVDYPIRELTPGAPPFSYRRTLRHIRRVVGRLAAKGLPVYAYGESVGGNLAEMLAVRARVAGSVAVAAPSDLLTWEANDRTYWRLLLDVAPRTPRRLPAVPHRAASAPAARPPQPRGRHRPV